MHGTIRRLFLAANENRVSERGMDRAMLLVRQAVMEWRAAEARRQTVLVEPRLRKDAGLDQG